MSVRGLNPFATGVWNQANMLSGAMRRGLSSGRLSSPPPLLVFFPFVDLFFVFAVAVFVLTQQTALGKIDLVSQFARIV